MCGIAGVVAWSEKYRLERKTLSALSARLAHRGPDAEGIYLTPASPISAASPQVGLVHRRLSILDLDPRANQPWIDSFGRAIVFNGEIYNFRDLRKELSSLIPSYRWRTTGDTEVLIVAYEQWKEKCVEHLNGMFAFAIWDPTNATLFAAVDRMGQKPFYWATTPDRSAIAFASELAALREIPWFDARINPESVSNYLLWGYIPAPATIYLAASKLVPATRTVFSSTGERSETYFDPNRCIKPSDPNSAAGKTRELVEKAVERQLVSDVPVGCFLSGGIDSSVIAAAMARQARVAGEVVSKVVQTFSIGFDDPRYDETAFAAAVAGHLGTDHHRFYVRPDAAADLPRLAEVFGEPFADSSALPTHYLARETRGFVKVALSGDGGDELFGGYDRYRAVRLARRLGAASPAISTLRPIWTNLPGTHPKSSGARLKRLLDSLSLPSADRYLSYLQLFSPVQMGTLLKEYQSPPSSLSVWARLYDRLTDSGDAVTAALAIDRISYLPGDLLVKLDRASMLHALEVRSPFMDHDLVQFAAGLRSTQLFTDGPKQLLRQAFAADLPAAVFSRQKMGFAVPIGQWFRGELRSLLRETLLASDAIGSSWFNRVAVEKLIDEHEKGTLDHSQRLYALLMFELWHRAGNGA